MKKLPPGGEPVIVGRTWLDDLTEGGDADPRWVSVSFLGQLPSGQRVEDVDPAQVAARLCYAFGFTAVVRLIVADAGVHPQADGYVVGSVGD